MSSIELVTITADGGWTYWTEELTQAEAEEALVIIRRIKDARVAQSATDDDKLSS